jgi:hypothetical protein
MLTYDVILIEEQEERQDPRDMEGDRVICHMINEAPSQPKTIERRERVRCLQPAARQDSNRPGQMGHILGYSRTKGGVFPRRWGLPNSSDITGLSPRTETVIEPGR